MERADFGGRKICPGLTLHRAPTERSLLKVNSAAPTDTFSFSIFPLFYWLAVPFPHFHALEDLASLPAPSISCNFLLNASFQYLSYVKAQKGGFFLLPYLQVLFLIPPFFPIHYHPTPNKKILSQIRFSLFDSPQIRKCHLILQHLCSKQNK